MKIVNRRVLCLLLVIPCLLITYKIYSSGIAIDTRFESAVSGQQNLAFIFQDTQTFNNNDYAIGSVEFRNGVMSSGFNQTLNLGVSPVFSGPLGVGPHKIGNDYSAVTYNILSDLTLEGAAFQGANSTSLNGWAVAFDFLNTATIFLESDFVLSNTNGISVNMFAFPGGTIDGRGNKFTIPVGSVVFVYGDLTLRNLTFVSASIQGIVVEVGNGISLRNVEIVTPLGSISFLSAVFTVSGTKNIFGYGGSIVIENNSPVYIVQESRITVTSGTTLILGPAFGGFFASPPITFTDITSELYLDSCTIDWSPQGSTHIFNIMRGTIYINGNVTFASGNGQGSYQFGDGINPANNANIVILPGSKLILGPGVTLTNMNV